LTRNTLIRAPYPRIRGTRYRIGNDKLQESDRPQPDRLGQVSGNASYGRWNHLIPGESPLQAEASEERERA